jgi:hypothetical protein
VARKEWLDANPDNAKAIVAGLDAAVDWLKANADKLLEDPYKEWMDGAGLLSEPAQTQLFLDLVKAGNYFTKSDTYTQAWIDNQYEFIQTGKGVLTDEVPPKENIFAAP